MDWIYRISLVMLWFVTGANLYSMIRSIRLSKRWEKTYDELFSDLKKSIADADRAERCFLEAAETYHTMCKELKEDRAE